MPGREAPPPTDDRLSQGVGFRVGLKVKGAGFRVGLKV